MAEITATLLEWGLYGLIIAAFTESFVSPILPDVVFFPMALAKPDQAIYYGVITTTASVLGGFIGYGIGYKIGLPAARKMIPEKHIDRIQGYVRDNAKWAVFFAALAPIPYKFVSITAGAMRVNLAVFVGISIIARGKRFLLPGVLIYYFGPIAEEWMSRYSREALFLTIAGLLIIVLAVWLVRRHRRKCEEQGRNVSL